MKPRSLFGLALGATLGASALAADVREGLVSYWPLDALIEGDTQTPDLVSSNHMTAVNFAPANVVTGQRGNAFTFAGGADGDAAARYLFWQDTYPTDPITGETITNRLPVANQRSLTVMYWVKGKGTGQNDKKVFSMTDETSTDPLFSFGTHSGGSNDSFDLYVRNNGNPVNHFRGGTPYDDTWRHVTWTDDNGVGRLYVDGVLTTNLNYTRPNASRRWSIASIGAVYRPITTVPQALFTGAIDDVAVWERALTAAEVQDVFANGIQTPVPKFPPSFTQQPVGSTSRQVGDDIILSVGAVIGPREGQGGFQWFKDGVAIPDQTAVDLRLLPLQLSDSGNYTFVATNINGATTSLVATVTVQAPPAPALKSGIVAYWPLDSVEGTKTPEIANGYDMTLINMSSTNIVTGRWGNAMQFYASSSSMLERENLVDDQISIYSKATNFTVSMWVNGPASQQDKRIFSESSSTSTQPLFNIGTKNAAGDTLGIVDTYIRTDTGATSGDHRYSAGTAYDDTWHHVVYVQKVIDGAMVGRLYIDGVLDAGGPNHPSPVRPLTATVTSIGGVRRGASTAPSRSFPFQGMIDDVTIWNRALSAEEIGILHTSGTPTPDSNVQPLAINRFASDLPAVGQSNSVKLSWDVSKDVTALTIDQGVGNVLPSTVVGLGSVSVTITNTTTFTLVATRGEESLTNRVTVAAIGGIAPNWALLDNFDRYEDGSFTTNGYWSDTRNAVITNLNGNKVLDLAGTEQTVILQLGNLAVPENENRTLFTRFIVQRDQSIAVSNFVGVTDRSLRFRADENDAGGVGPELLIGTNAFGTRNSPGGLPEFLPEPLIESNVVYNVWIDIVNGPLVADADTGDYFTIHIQKDGETERTVLFQDYYSNRSPIGDPGSAGGALTRPILDKLIVGNHAASSVLFDDFYISKSGFNATVPRPFGYTTAIGQEAPAVSIGRNADKVRIIYSGGTLQSAPAVTGPWNNVDGAASPYEVTPSGTETYYKVRQ